MEKYLIEQVDALFTNWDRPDSPGCVLGLIREGELIYTRGYGMSNLEYGIPLTPQSALYLASNSKQFTAACIVLLAQRGLISLQDDIRKYFPEMPAYAHPITVEHLFYHTSGLREHGALSGLAGLCPLDYNIADSVAMICRQKDVNYPAGETYLYNNAGYVLQAEIIRRVTGQSQPVFAKENIFDPLGMNDTVFSDDCGLIVKNRAASYEPDGRGGFRCLLAANNVPGSAGVITTVGDLFHWDQNFYQPKVGGEGFIRQMLTTGKFNDGRDVGYSAGLVHSEVCGQKAISHGGTEFGYRSITMRFPEQRFSILCLANLSTFKPAVIAEQIAGLFFKGSSPAPSSPSKVKSSIPAAKLDEISGFYYDAATGAFIELSRRGERINANDEENESEPLAVTGHESTSEKETITLEYNNLGTSSSMKLKLVKDKTAKSWSMQPEAMQCRLPILQQTAVVHPGSEALMEYSGMYYSAELKCLYEVALSDGHLALVNLTGLHGDLKCGPAGVFTIGWNSLRFTRRSDGKVNRFTLWSLSARGIEFVRIKQAGV